METGNTQRELERVGRLVSEWRRGRVAGDPMPRELWDAAARLAARCGVTKVARELRLDGGKLGRLAAAQMEVSALGFVELTGPESAPRMVARVCEAELVRPDGYRLVLRTLAEDQWHGLAAWFVGARS